MRKARLITIGTEITSGEVVNSNAAWVSLRLEELGVRVFSHLSVRDQQEEILKALELGGADDILIVTGGLGPTSDDITRECMAAHLKRPLQFDEQVWQSLSEFYRQRQLPLREAHKHQCYFPEGSTRLRNPAGSALGFACTLGEQVYFVLPGPPRELEAIWNESVEPALKKALPLRSERWVRWTCLGAPESEIAEIVEKVIAGLNIEVGYRAQIPYVKVKIYVDPNTQSATIQALDSALEPFIVGRGWEDLAEDVLGNWPLPELHVHDDCTDTAFFARLLRAKNSSRPKLALHPLHPATGFGLFLTSQGDELITEVRLPSGTTVERKILPYKIKLDSERGRRSAVEWALWTAVRALRSQPSTSA